MKDYDSGVTAIIGMLKGEADIAEAAEFPFVRAVFRKEKILAIACNDKFENDYLWEEKIGESLTFPILKGRGSASPLEQSMNSTWADSWH